MASWRERESQRQAFSREQNESTARRRAAGPADGSDGLFRCECGNHQCACAIPLTLTEYELVRASATHFAVALNHENPESEQVIHENEHFAVVETVTADATKLARRSDPRQRRRESRWRRSVRSGKP